MPACKNGYYCTAHLLLAHALVIGAVPLATLRRPLLGRERNIIGNCQRRVALMNGKRPAVQDGPRLGVLYSITFAGVGLGGCVQLQADASVAAKQATAAADASMCG